MSRHCAMCHAPEGAMIRRSTSTPTFAWIDGASWIARGDAINPAEWSSVPSVVVLDAASLCEWCRASALSA